MKKKDIDKINLTELSKFITNEESKGFFLEEAGKEHYKLLAYLSKSQNGITISDIGTFRGCSALALAYNKKNKVISYDISNSKTLNGYPENIQFVVTDDAILGDVIESKIIFVDVMHDGVYEGIIIDFLTEYEYKGIVVFDDIHLNAEMIKFWNGIDQRKEDITSVGHWSGTGIVYFE